MDKVSPFYETVLFCNKVDASVPPHRIFLEIDVGDFFELFHLTRDMEKGKLLSIIYSVYSYTIELEKSTKQRFVVLFS